MSKLDTSIMINKYFEEISAIPHGSFNEKELCDYIENFVKELKLEYFRDEMDNIIVYKPASSGFEDHEPVMLQGHLDMVNEKNNDSKHDFIKDSLSLYVEDGYLKAKGTTLGADDGCGVAYMLAILADKSLKHPRLECVFTVQEEVGLLGAMNIKKENIHSKRMIGLDSGDENEVCISSSGGRRTIITKKVDFIEDFSSTYELIIDGLLGGHSGGEIHLEKGNANKIASRVMYYLISNDIDIKLIDINGGLKENAIARECKVIFNSNSTENEIRKLTDKVLNDVKFELEFSDKDVNIRVNKINQITKVIDLLQSNQIIKMMYIMPNGFMHKSMVIEGLTTVSLNMGVIRLEDNILKIYYSIRSPMMSAKEDLSNQLGCIAELFNAQYVVKNDYPGWQYDKDSKFRKQYIDFVKEVEGTKIIPVAGHGGLETGIFKGLIEELDIIAIGPNMQFIHTPDEQLELNSFIKCYNRLTKFLEIL